MESLLIETVRAFDDNYIWCLRRGSQAVVVDPGDAGPVLRHLDSTDAHLVAILLTHHHGDHAGGVETLAAGRPLPVFGPATENIPGLNRPVRGGDSVALDELGIEFRILDVPGHTRGHVAYYGAKLPPDGAVFCGDTLFAGGCGRIFEGTPDQMYASLSRLAALPPGTAVYCAHEYTQANLRFALAVEPENEDLRRRIDQVAAIRLAGNPTVPSLMADELATNPFLRSDKPTVAAAALGHGADGVDPARVFAAIREWKNGFR